MKRTRFTEEQIVAVLREHEAGQRRPIWREVWDLGSDAVQLEGQIRRQKMVGPAAKAVAHLRGALEMSERRACTPIAADRTMIRYYSRRPLDTELLRREGEPSGINRIYRLYREEGLMVRKRRGRRRAVGTRAPILVESKANARRSLDFVHDQFARDRRFRILNVVDDVTRECLAAIPDTSLSGRRVARELTTPIETRGKPRMIVTDHGTEFASNAILGWATFALASLNGLR